MLRSCCFSCQFGTLKCNLSSTNGHFKCILKISYWLSTYSWKSCRRSQNVQVSNVAIWFSLKDNAEKTKAAGYLGYVREERGWGCANGRAGFYGIVLNKLPLKTGGHPLCLVLMEHLWLSQMENLNTQPLLVWWPHLKGKLQAIMQLSGGTWTGARAGEA